MEQNTNPSGQNDKQTTLLERKKQRTLPMMNDDEYIQNRLEDQMTWFDKKSTEHQRKYKTLRLLEIIIGASVPVLISMSTSAYFQNFTLITDFSASDLMQVLATIGGVFVIVFGKQLELEDHHRYWKDYRVNAEQLRYQLMLYKTGTTPYNKPNAYHLLVMNTETLLNQENIKWQQSGHKKEEIMDMDEDEL